MDEKLAPELRQELKVQKDRNAFYEKIQSHFKKYDGIKTIDGQDCLLAHPGMLSERQMLSMRWDVAGELKDVDDPYIHMHYSTMLENQRLYCMWEEPVSKNIRDQSNGNVQELNQWGNASIEISKMIYDPKRFVPWHIVGVTSHLGPNDNQLMFGWTSKGMQYFHEPMTATTKRLRSHITGDIFNGTVSDDLMPTYVEILGEEISMEISREVLCDLRNNAGSRGQAKKEYLWPLCKKMADNIQSKIGYRANWLVMAPETARGLDIEIGTPPWGLSTSIHRTEKLVRDGYEFDVFVDPLFPKSEVLTGYKCHENPYFSGYFYSTYVPLCKALVFNPEAMDPALVFMHRRAKKLLKSEGAKFYGRMHIED